MNRNVIFFQLVSCIIVGLFAVHSTGCKNSDLKEKDARPLIAIQPYGTIEARQVDSVAAILSRMYSSKVIILGSAALPASSYVKIKSPRYRADVLIRLLKIQKPDTVDLILGLTNQDISTTKRDAFGRIKTPESRYNDWGIFGLGYRPGVACVISSYRLTHHSQNVFIKRLQKVALHEIGHNYGLPHCKTEYCVMQDAVETIKTIDKVRSQLCRTCSAKQKRNVL